MKIRVAAVAFCLVASGVQAQNSKDGWVTFKTSRNSSGKIEHQIELRTIKQEGAYRSFWTRLWVPAEKQAMVFSFNEQMFFASQKYLVDCPGRRFGTDTVDSVSPKKEKYATVPTMHWASLDKFPAVAKSVCGEK
jgi:hypothetical protein